MNERKVMESENKEIIQAEKLMNLGKYNEALLLLENLENGGDLKASDQLSYHLLQSSILNKLGNYKDSYKIGEKAYKESQNMESHLQTVDALANMAHALIWLGDLEKGDKLVLESESILKSLKNESIINLEQREASLACIKSSISLFKGEILQAVEYGKNSLKINEKYGNKHDIIESLNAIGMAHSFVKSDLDTALNYVHRCQALAKEINHQLIIHTSYKNLGVIYFQKGEFEKALKYFEQALPFFERSNNIQWISTIVNNIATIYLDQGKYNKAVDYIKRNLYQTRVTGNNRSIAAQLCTLIEGFKHLGDIDSAKKYLKELKQINSQENNKWIEMSYLLSKAWILKESPRLHDHTKAEQILKDIIHREVLPSLDYITDALVNLCELLLDELRITNDIGVLGDLNPYLKKLLDIAEKTNSFWVLAETYVLQAKLALLTLDLKGARRLLTKAQEIAEKNGMHRLAAKISIEHDELLEKLNLWENFKDSEASLSERFRLTNMNEQIKTMIQKRRSDIPEILEEIPVMILVISEGGVPTFSKLFTEALVIEDDLISGFLATFNTFSSEFFSEGLDRATFGQYKLLMRPISTFLVCYLFKGQSFPAQKKIQNFVENIKKDEDLLEKFKHYYQTNQVINLKDVPALDLLITEIFIEKNFN